MNNWIKSMILELQDHLGSKWVEIGRDIMQADAMTQAVMSQQDKLSKDPYGISRKEVGTARAQYKEYGFRIEKVMGPKGSELILRISDDSHEITAYLSKNAIDYLRNHNNIAVDIESLNGTYGRLYKGHFIISTDKNRKINLYIEKMSYIGDRPRRDTLSNKITAYPDINNISAVQKIREKITEEINIYRNSIKMTDIGNIIEEKDLPRALSSLYKSIDESRHMQSQDNPEKISQPFGYISQPPFLPIESLNNALGDFEADAIASPSHAPDANNTSGKRIRTEDAQNTRQEKKAQENPSDMTFPLNYAYESPTKQNESKRIKKSVHDLSESRIEVIDKRSISRNTDEIPSVDINTSQIPQKKSLSSQKHEHSSPIRHGLSVSDTAPSIKYVANTGSPIKKTASHPSEHSPKKSLHSTPVKKEKSKDTRLIKKIVACSDENDTLNSIEITPSILKTIEQNMIKEELFHRSKETVKNEKVDSRSPVYCPTPDKAEDEWSSVEEVTQNQIDEMVEETISYYPPILTLSEYMRNSRKSVHK